MSICLIQSGARNVVAVGRPWLLQAICHKKGFCGSLNHLAKFKRKMQLSNKTMLARDRPTDPSTAVSVYLPDHVNHTAHQVKAMQVRPVRSCAAVAFGSITELSCEHMAEAWRWISVVHKAWTPSSLSRSPKDQAVSWWTSAYGQCASALDPDTNLRKGNICAPDLSGWTVHATIRNETPRIGEVGRQRRATPAL